MIETSVFCDRVQGDSTLLLEAAGLGLAAVPAGLGQMLGYSGISSTGIEPKVSGKLQSISYIL